MHALLEIYRSTIGKKIIMAVTGIVLVLFVIGHMTGNLKMFMGFDPAIGDFKMDEYARFLREIGTPLLPHGVALWIARIGLIICLVLHVVMGIQLSLRNKIAKPIDYRSQSYGASTIASRTMIYGGPIILVFVIFHLLHMTFGTVHTNGFVEGQVYANVYRGFQTWVIVFVYIAAMAVLGFHLYHGAWSVFQSLGINSPKLSPTFKLVAKLIAIILFVGFSAVPIAAVTKMLSSPEALEESAHHMVAEVL